MVPGLERWNDERLDDLKRDVDRMRDPVGNVNVVRTELRSLGKSVDQLRENVGQLSKLPEALAVLTTEVTAVVKKVDELIGQPHAERRMSNAALRRALLASIGGGVVVLLVSWMLGLPVHA